MVKLYTDTLEKELCNIKWKAIDKLQTNKIKTLNLEIERVLLNVEYTFINPARKLLIKTRFHKESEAKNKKNKNKKWFHKACKNLKISKSFTTF